MSLCVKKNVLKHLSPDLEIQFFSRQVRIAFCLQATQLRVFVGLEHINKIQKANLLGLIQCRDVLHQDIETFEVIILRNVK